MTEQPPMDPNATPSGGDWGSSGTPPPPPSGSPNQPGWGPPPPGAGYGAPPGYGNPPGYGAPPGYGPPGYPPAMGTNAKATWSLVLAILGFLCPVGFVGIILGLQAKKECEQTGQDGAGLAQAGFIVGIVSTVWFVLVLLNRAGA